MSEQLMDALDKALGGKQATGNWHSWQADQAVLACARRLHRTVLPRFAELWRQPTVLEELVVPQPQPEAEPVAGLAAGSAQSRPGHCPMPQAGALERSRARPGTRRSAAT
jgi:hypothetical protein